MRPERLVVGLDGDALRRFARRLKQISDLFKKVWTSAGAPSPINSRVRIVLAGQSSNLSRFDNELKFINKNPSMGQGVITVTWKRVKDARTTAQR